MPGLRVSANKTLLRIGTCGISFERTLRVPESGHKPYPLPPTFGSFPLVILQQKPLRIGLPIYQREALWIAFDCSTRPCAVLVGSGAINVISGEPWSDELRRSPQNYLVCPDQPWLDGFKTTDGSVRQFVAMPLGEGYTVSEQLGGAASHELHLVVYEGRPGITKPRRQEPRALSQPMGLAAGGHIRQKVYPDLYSEGAWYLERKGGAEVVLLSAAEYRERAGEEPPPTPIDAQTYTEHGLPWFELYDTDKADISGSPRTKAVKSPGEVDRAKGIKQGHDQPVNVGPASVKQIRRPRSKKNI